MWFVGSGEPDVWLYLTNSGTAQASVDVTILTDTGQQSGLANAITVAPDQVVAENVSPFVHGAQAIALHVQTSSGQIAASVWEGAGSGNGGWLPQAAAPSTTVVIPGLTVASSSARLFVTVPGATDAKLKIVAYTPAGANIQFGSGSNPVQASAARDHPGDAQLARGVGGRARADVERADRGGRAGPRRGNRLVHGRGQPRRRSGRGSGEPGHSRSHHRPAAHRARGGCRRQRQRHRLGRHRHLACRPAERDRRRRAHARRRGAATVRAGIRSRSCSRPRRARARSTPPGW